MERFQVYFDYDAKKEHDGLQAVFYVDKKFKWHDVIGAKIVKMELNQDKNSLYYGKMLVTLEK